MKNKKRLFSVQCDNCNCFVAQLTVIRKYKKTYIKTKKKIENFCIIHSSINAIFSLTP